MAPTGTAPGYPPYTVVSGYLNYKTTMQPPQPTTNLIKVSGPEGAKAYPLGPNSSIVLWDENESVFYFKKTDDSRFATMKTFEFSERTPDIIAAAVTSTNRR